MGLTVSMERIESFVERSGFNSLEEFAEDYETKAEERITNVLNEMGIWGLVKTKRKTLVPKDKIAITVGFGSFLNETLSLRFLMNEVIRMFIVDKPYKHKVRFYVEIRLSFSGSRECDGITYIFHYD
jgi:hypothetical protein